jgi:hypothetical protein
MISRDEWMKWHEQGFTAATTVSEARMPAADYESMEWVKAYARPRPEKAGQNKQ